MTAFTVTNQAAKIGDGGYAKRMAIHSSGVMLVGGDYPGLTGKPAGSEQWQWVLNPNPGGNVDPALVDYGAASGTAGSVYEVAIHPANPLLMYAHIWGTLLKSTNGFAGPWTATALPKLINHNGNTAGAFHGVHIMLDPLDQNVVMVGTFDATVGVQVSVNQGAAFTKIAGLPVPTAEIGASIAIDVSSAPSGGRTGRWIISIWGQGIYQTAGGPQGAFAAIAGAPTQFHHVHCTAAGVLMVTGPGLFRRYAAGAWTTPTGAGNQSIGVASDPANPARVWVEQNGTLAVSVNSGADFSGFTGIPWRDGADIPWHGWTAEFSMTAAKLEWNPSINGLSFIGGIGHFQLPSPPLTVAGTDGEITWRSVSVGRESMVTVFALKLPTNPYRVIYWVGQDRGGQPMDERDMTLSYQRRHSPDNLTNLYHGNNATYAMDDPKFVVGAFNSGLFQCDDPLGDWTPYGPFTSVDFFNGGRTVSMTMPGGTGIAGAVGMRNKADGVVWLPTYDRPPYLCKGGAVQPVRCDFGAGANAAFDAGIVGGWPGLYNILRQPICRDEATGYLYMYLVGDPNAGQPTHHNNVRGVWRSTDGGATWTRRYAGYISEAIGDTVLGYGVDYWHRQIMSVPGYPNTLIHITGSIGDLTAADPVRGAISTDGGQSWTGIGPASGAGSLVDIRALALIRPLSGNLSEFPTMVAYGEAQGYHVLENLNPAAPTKAWSFFSKFLPSDGQFDLPSYFAGDMEKCVVYACMGSTGGQVLTFTPS